LEASSTHELKRLKPDTESSTFKTSKATNPKQTKLIFSHVPVPGFCPRFSEFRLS
jgi:hypothetical protein